jgi:hypothetical protein
MLSVRLTPSDHLDTYHFHIDILSPPSINDTNEPRAIVNARNLYQSCVDEQNIEDEGMASILSLINAEFGGWPIIQSSTWDNTTFNLLSRLLKLRRYNNNIIFGIGTSIDDKNSTEYDLGVSANLCEMSTFSKDDSRWAKAISV